MTDDHLDEAYFERLVDKDRLKQYLQENLGEAATFEIEQHQSGHGNQTLFLTWGDREYVIRRPPPRRRPRKHMMLLGNTKSFLRSRIRMSLFQKPSSNATTRQLSGVTSILLTASMATLSVIRSQSDSQPRRRVLPSAKS